MANYVCMYVFCLEDVYLSAATSTVPGDGIDPFYAFNNVPFFVC